MRPAGKKCRFFFCIKYKPEKWKIYDGRVVAVKKKKKVGKYADGARRKKKIRVGFFFQFSVSIGQNQIFPPIPPRFYVLFRNVRVPVENPTMCFFFFLQIYRTELWIKKKKINFSYPQRVQSVQTLHVCIPTRAPLVDVEKIEWVWARRYFTTRT